MRPNVSVAGKLRLASQLTQRRVEEHVRACGFTDVSLAQCFVFRFEGPEGRRPTEIATDVGMSKQAVNDSLQHLEACGYLTRVPDPEDGRARVVRLTQHGEALQDAVRAAGGHIERELAASISDPDWSAFCRVLDQLAAPGMTVEPDA